MKADGYNFNYGWEFLLADAFPLTDALEAVKDGGGRAFYEREYQAKGWKEVSLPHTYNDEDLFVDRIQDAGSGQKRTFSCYRKWFSLKECIGGGKKTFSGEKCASEGEASGGEGVRRREGCSQRESYLPEEELQGGRFQGKIFLELEGVRQTCYLYVNGRMAGYYEAGAFPVGFDITEYLAEGDEQLIAIATDSTSSRNMDVIGAETPNHPEAEPGAFAAAITGPGESRVPEAKRGVPYQWNCNDFNPTVGGLARNIRLHVKPKTYLTLPLYSNLKTKGVYVYGTDFDIQGRKAKIHVEAEVRNESGRETESCLEVTLYDGEGRRAAVFTGGAKKISSTGDCRAFKTVIPANAYRKTEKRFEPVDEEEAGETETASWQVETLTAEAEVSDLTFWEIDNPYLYRVRVTLFCDGKAADVQELDTGFRKVTYDGSEGLKINDVKVWLTGYAQRATNEWAALGCAPDWLKDYDAKLIRESGANHIRFMHVAGAPADVRSFDRFGVVCTQPAGDKEREVFGRQWKQRVELMRDTIIYFRNHPSILFWEAGNNAINKEHMREMRLLKEKLDPAGGRFMGCRTINTQEVIEEAEYAGTMLNRHAASFIAGQVPITETEYLREESPRRVWDDYTPPCYDYDNLWLGRAGRKQPGYDFYDLNAEEFAIRAAAGYQEFFHDRMGGASGKNLYSAAAALCWTDSAQHGRQAHSENGRMSGRVDPVRIKKQNFRVFQVMQSPTPDAAILGHWNYPPVAALDGTDISAADRADISSVDRPDVSSADRLGVSVKAGTDISSADRADIPAADKVEVSAKDRPDVSSDGLGVSVKAGSGVSAQSGGEAYRYALKEFDGTAWVKTGEYAYRNPKDKTVYAVGSYGIARVELYVNGVLAGSCDKPIHTFIFPIPHVDVTQPGTVSLKAYDYEGRLAAEDRIETAGEPASLRLAAVTGEAGFLADGADAAFIDVEVVDEAGRICPLCDRKICFAVEGPAEFLGGYNSGRFRGPDRDDSVIHKDYVYAECGVNRVFLRSRPKAGRITVTAWMEGAGGEEIRAAIVLETMEAPRGAVTEETPGRLSSHAVEGGVVGKDAFPAIPKADEAKYVKKEGLYCKVLVNGQEPNTNGVLSRVDHGSIYSPILYILEALHGKMPGAFTYNYENKVLTLDSGEYHVQAEVGRTHMLVNGEENLLNGQPYENEEGCLILEINALISYIQGVKASYDEKANLFRIEV